MPKPYSYDLRRKVISKDTLCLTSLPMWRLLYVEITHKYGLTPAQMALAYVRSRWFVTSTIIGATTMAQLPENLSSIEVELDEGMIKEIDEVHARIPNPTP